MFRILLLFCAAVMSTAALAQLPEDGEKYSLIVLTPETSTPAGDTLLRQLDTDPQLVAIAASCHVHRWKPSSKLYQARYMQSLPPSPLPVVALARSDGGVVWKASGANVPTSAKALATALIDAATKDQAAHRRNSLTSVANYGDSASVPATDPTGFPLPFSIPNPFSGLIPDSITIEPQLPDMTKPLLIGGGILLVVLFFGFVGLVLVGGLFLFLFLRR